MFKCRMRYWPSKVNRHCKVVFLVLYSRHAETCVRSESNKFVIRFNKEALKAVSVEGPLFDIQWRMCTLVQDILEPESGEKKSIHKLYKYSLEPECIAESFGPLEPRLHFSIPNCPAKAARKFNSSIDVLLLNILVMGALHTTARLFTWRERFVTVGWNVAILKQSVRCFHQIHAQNVRIWGKTSRESCTTQHRQCHQGEDVHMRPCAGNKSTWRFWERNYAYYALMSLDTVFVRRFPWT